MKNLKVILIFQVMTTLMLGSCQPKGMEIKPPEILYGQDVCERCGMIIGEARFSSAAQLENGDYVKFDDAGEMFAYFADQSTEHVIAWWVHDYLNEQWIDGKTAYFIKSPSFSTPMGSGVTCFANEAQASAFAEAHGGELYTFEEIQNGTFSHSQDG